MRRGRSRDACEVIVCAVVLSIASDHLSQGLFSMCNGEVGVVFVDTDALGFDCYKASIETFEFNDSICRQLGFDHHRVSINALAPHYDGDV